MPDVKEEIKKNQEEIKTRNPIKEEETIEW